MFSTLGQTQKQPHVGLGAFVYELSGCAAALANFDTYKFAGINFVAPGEVRLCRQSTRPRPFPFYLSLTMKFTSALAGKRRRDMWLDRKSSTPTPPCSRTRKNTPNIIHTHHRHQPFSSAEHPLLIPMCAVRGSLALRSCEFLDAAPLLWPLIDPRLKSAWFDWLAHCDFDWLTQVGQSAGFYQNQYTIFRVCKILPIKWMRSVSKLQISAAYYDLHMMMNEPAPRVCFLFDILSKWN